MTREEFDILLSAPVREAIEQNLSREPYAIALDSKLPYARLVASQVKLLQRIRTKHPRFYDARCILLERAVEQSSSDECAARKPLCGDTLLDLTCGLGGDTIALSGSFRRVVSLERDALLADVVRENLRRLDITNVDVLTCSAEEYVARCDTHFSAIIVDPDRRVGAHRSVRLEDSSPDVVALMPRLRTLAERVVVKCSPLFDVAEAWRLFPDASVEVVSLGGECKELLIYLGEPEPRLTAVAVGRGEFSVALSHLEAVPMPERFRGADYRYLIIPDVALQKARLVRYALRGKADCWHENSFGFAPELVDVVGRVEPIETVEPLDWKALKRRFRGCGVDIILRDTPLSLEQIHKRLGSHSGSDYRLAFCSVGGEHLCICLA